MELHEKLHQLRKEKGLTQAELAEILNVSRQSISNWELGVIEPSIKRLKRLSQLYGVSLDYLVNENGKVNSEESCQKDRSTLGKITIDKIEGEPNEDSEEYHRSERGSIAVNMALLKQKRVILVALIVTIILCIAGAWGCIWWLNQPKQQFYYWEVESSADPKDNGISLFVDSIARNKDGSGSLAYTIKNEANESKYWGPNDPWVDYENKGTWHRVYPEKSIETLKMSQANVLNGKDSESKTIVFPANTFKLPGRYRFCIDGAGSVDFLVKDNGKVVIGYD